MAQSGFNAEFLRAWQNEKNTSIDDVVAELNGELPEGEKPPWDKKKAQKEATRYRQAGVNIRKFSRQKLNAIDPKAAADFLAGLPDSLASVTVPDGEVETPSE